jgi:hypothetical protein
VANSPVNFIDPSGQCACSVVVKCRPLAFGGARRIDFPEHCYFVVKERSGAKRTIEGRADGGFLLGGRLHSWNLPFTNATDALDQVTRFN